MDYHFSQRDVEKAIRGALKAGLRVGRAEIDPRTGRIILVHRLRRKVQAIC